MNFKKVVTIAAAGALTALAVPAMADMTPYASVRLATFYNTNQAAYNVGAAQPDTNTDFDLRNQSNSRFGAKFADGKLAGQVEFGLGLGNGGGNTTVYTRLIYGTYKFDFGTLLVGQAYTPYTVLTEQVANDDNGNIGYGALYDGRQAQIKLSLNNGLYVAAIRANGKAASTATAPADAVGTVAASETYIPKLNVGYEGKAGNFAFGAGVLGQTYKLVLNDKQVNSLLGYFHGKVVAGPADVGFNVGIGQNLGDMGLSEGLAAAALATTDVENNLTVSAMATVGYTVSPTVKLNAGLAYMTTDGKTAAGADFAKADNKMAAFVNTNITIAKNFTITPEFTYFDNLDDNSATNVAMKGAKTYIYGAKWMMNF